jgi:hypothetical protein
MRIQSLPVSAALSDVAKKLLWWEPEAVALEDPVRFACHVMTLGTWNDVMTVRRELGDSLFRTALSHAPPGIFDERSWNYWHLVYGILPVPPLPARDFS